MPETCSLLLSYVGSWGVFDRRVVLAAHLGGVDMLSGAGIEPLAPVLPPGTLVFFGVLAPVCGGIEGAAVLGRPVAALALGWGVDHARNVALVGKGEAGGAVGEFRYLPRRGPGDDVVPLGADGVDV